MTEHVLVVGSGHDLPARIRQTGLGVETSVICRLDFLAKLRETTEHARVIGVRHDAPDSEWVALASAAHEQHPFTRIAAFGERDQDRCALIGEALGLYAHSTHTVAMVYDKQAMRRRLREVGVDLTGSRVVTDAENLRSFVDKYGLPCVVKPVSGAGSAGVAVIRDAGSLASAFARASQRFEGWHHSGVMIEQFHEGPQFSIEALSERGEHQVVAITRKFSDPTTFIELGHVVPAELDRDQQTQIHALVYGVLTALDVQFGVTHTEIVLTEAGPRVIETHVRMAGDEIPSLVMSATGVDLEDCIVRQTVGKQVLEDVRAILDAGSLTGCAAIWFVASSAAGTLKAVDGLERAQAIEGVTHVRLLTEPGDPVGLLQSSDSRVAYVKAVGIDARSAIHAAREGAARLRLQLEVQAVGDTAV